MLGLLVGLKPVASVRERGMCPGGRTFPVRLPVFRRCGVVNRLCVLDSYLLRWIPSTREVQLRWPCRGLGGSRSEVGRLERLWSRCGASCALTWGIETCIGQDYVDAAVQQAIAIHVGRRTQLSKDGLNGDACHV